MTTISNLSPQLQRASTETARAVDPLLTDREAAALFRVGLSTFRRYVAQGLVPPPIKLGGCSRWSQAELLGIIEQAKSRRTMTRQNS